MDYYVRKAEKDGAKIISLLIIATSKNGAEIIELSSEDLLTTTHIKRTANIHDGLEKISALEYAIYKNAMLKNLDAIITEVDENTIEALYPQPITYEPITGAKP